LNLTPFESAAEMAPRHSVVINKISRMENVIFLFIYPPFILMINLLYIIYYNCYDLIL